MKTIFYNATIVTQNLQREIIPLGFIVISGPKIEAIKKGKPSINDFKSCAKKINCAGTIILPGLINAHIHLGESIFTFLLKENLSLEKYLNFTDKVCEINPLIEKNRSVISDYSIMLLVKNGVSTICGGRIQNHCRNWSVRNVSGYMVMQSPKLIKYYNKIRKKFDFNKKDGLMSAPAIFIHSLNRVDQKKLRDVRNLMKKWPGIKLIIHTLETKKSENEVVQKYGIGSIEVLNQNKLLSKDTILIHCNWANRNDLQMIQQSKASIVHCLSSNLNCSDKTLDLPAVIKMGINIAVATDGLTTSKNQDLLLEAKYCLNYHNKSHIKKIDPQKILDMITIDAAKVLGLEKIIGSLEIGKKADILLIALKNLSKKYGPLIHRLIYSDSSKMIKNLMINGKIILRANKIKLHKSERMINFKIKNLAKKITLPS